MNELRRDHSNRLEFNTELNLHFLKYLSVGYFLKSVFDKK